MFGEKGRVLIAVLIVLALAIPTVSVLASGSAAPSAGPVSAPAGELSWELVHQAPPKVVYYTIYFPTKDVGYAAGGPDWNLNSGRGAPISISKTTDGGKTWVTSTVPNTDGWARGLTCTDANNCWIAGNNTTRLQRTTDGGKTWTGFSNVSGYTKFLWSAGWTKNGNTILAGTTCYDPESPGNTANWIRSTDGQTFKAVQAVPGTYMCLVQWDIECPTPGYCYSAGKNYVWRSSNDGTSWAQTSPGLFRWYGLSCTANSTCWVSGKYPHMKSTTNSGGTWTTNIVNGLPSGGQFWDVAMVNDRVGYAGGCNNVATDNTDTCLGNGVLYKTEDGMTWNPITSPTKSDIMDVWAFSEIDVYLVDFSGKIWHGTGAPPPTSTPTATPTSSLGSVNGVAFDDVNGDALQDQGEPGIGGATLLLRRGRTEIATAISSADGAFSFSGIEPGQYTVEGKSPPPGFERSRFLGTFAIEANRPLTLYLPHDAVVETPTPTPSNTPEPTATPSATPTATNTPEPTATATAGSAGAEKGYLPVVIR